MSVLSWQGPPCGVSRNVVFDIIPPIRGHRKMPWERKSADTSYHDARALVPHLAYDLDETCYKVRTLNVFVSFVENDELVERLPCISHISEKLEQHNEEAKRLIFFDELVSEVNDH